MTEHELSNEAGGFGTGIFAILPKAASKWGDADASRPNNPDPLCQAAHNMAVMKNKQLVQEDQTRGKHCGAVRQWANNRVADEVEVTKHTKVTPAQPSRNVGFASEQWRDVGRSEGRARNQSK